MTNPPALTVEMVQNAFRAELGEFIGGDPSEVAGFVAALNAQLGQQAAALGVQELIAEIKTDWPYLHFLHSKLDKLHAALSVSPPPVTQDSTHTPDGTTGVTGAGLKGRRS